jgi:hypothetical protein
MSLPVAAFFTGCGGDDHLSKSEYEKQFRDATQAALVAGEKNGSAGSGPEAQRAARDARAAAIVRGLASRLEKLDAPSEVKGAQDDLVGGLRAQAAEIEQAVAAYRNGDRKPLDALDSRGGPSRDIAEREQHALEEFKEKGYSVANAD